MIGFRYREWDPTVLAEMARFKQLRDLFKLPPLKMNGDAEMAMDLLRRMQAQGYVDPDLDIDASRGASARMAWSRTGRTVRSS